MRTNWTRVTMTAVGVVLTGASLAGVSHATEGDELGVAEQPGNLEPCDELSASQDMLLPIDPDAVPDDKLLPTPADDPDKPLFPGEFDLYPCYQIAVPDDGGDDDGGDDGEDEPADDGDQADHGDQGDDGDQGGQSGDGADGQSGQSQGSPNTGDGVSDEGFGDATDDGTSQHDESVTPTAASADGGNGTLMLAMLAGALGAVGLWILIYGLRKRPRHGQQPAR